MRLEELFAPDAVITELRAADKRQALELIAARLAGVAHLPERRVREAMTLREELGSTGFGQGMALPHARLAEADRPHGLLARLARPVDFLAVDGLPVDLVCALVGPEATPAMNAALAAVCRTLRGGEVAAAMRCAPDARALHGVLIGLPLPGARPVAILS